VHGHGTTDNENRFQLERLDQIKLKERQGFLTAQIELHRW
jgi:hypothetical protein